MGAACVAAVAAVACVDIFKEHTEVLRGEGIVCAHGAQPWAAEDAPGLTAGLTAGDGVAEDSG